MSQRNACDDGVCKDDMGCPAGTKAMPLNEQAYPWQTGAMASCGRTCARMWVLNGIQPGTG
ncbi:hypothetical protein GCM10027288_42980 [Bordetella tumbae]